jgi:hypothetical protein
MKIVLDIVGLACVSVEDDAGLPFTDMNTGITTVIALLDSTLERATASSSRERETRRE